LAAIVSLRRSLRKVPEFSPLPSSVLNEIISQMSLREYKQGEILWRAVSKLDFIGFIQSGEIIVEHWREGRLTHAETLLAGDFITPDTRETKKAKTIVLIRARSTSRLFILNEKKLKTVNLEWRMAGNKQVSPPRLSQSKILNLALTVLMSILITAAGWQDISRILSSGLYLISGELGYSTHEEQDPIRLLGYAQSIDHTAAFPYNAEGLLWLARNNLSLARNAFTNAVDLDRSNAPALNNLAVLYLSENQAHQAVALQRKSTQANPDSALAHYNLGIILSRQREYISAIRELRQASYIDTSWDLPHTQQAYIYLQIQNYALAEQEARIAISLNSNQASSHLIQGIALYNLGQYQLAFQAIENTLGISPEDEVAQFYRALILIHLDHENMAVPILQKLLNNTTDPKKISRITAELNSLQLSCSSLEGCPERR